MKKMIIVLIFCNLWFCSKEKPKPAQLFIRVKSGLVLRKDPKVLPKNAIGLLKAGERVTILEEGTVQKIGRISSPWFKIETKDKKTGWVFGGFAYKTINPASSIKFVLISFISCWDDCLESYCHDPGVVSHLKEKTLTWAIFFELLGIGC